MVLPDETIFGDDDNRSSRAGPTDHDVDRAMMNPVTRAPVTQGALRDPGLCCATTMWSCSAYLRSVPTTPVTPVTRPLNPLRRRGDIRVERGHNFGFDFDF